MAELSPVNLHLLRRQRSQAQVRLGFGPRPVLSDEVAEVIHPAAVTALAHHRVQARGGEGGKLLQGLDDEGQVALHARGPLQQCRTGHARLGQYARHRRVMEPELTGDGAHAPLLGVEVAQDLCFLFSADGQA